MVVQSTLVMLVLALCVVDSIILYSLTQMMVLRDLK